MICSYNYKKIGIHSLKLCTETRSLFFMDTDILMQWYVPIQKTMITAVIITRTQKKLETIFKMHIIQGSQEQEVKFQDQMFTKFQDNFRTFLSVSRGSRHRKCTFFCPYKCYSL